jgi:hypothetical protein
VLLGFPFSELYEQIISLLQLPGPGPALRRSPPSMGADHPLSAFRWAIGAGIAKVRF